MGKCVTSGLRVLLVEDEALLRTMIGEMLTEMGHRIVGEAAELDAAIRLASEADYDLGLLDLNLGNGIAYDVVEVVLQRGKAVVLSTGYGRAILGPRYESCIVVQKPYTAEVIGRAIQLSAMQTVGIPEQEAAGSA